MTTIWRPHPLIEHIKPVEEEVPDDDVPDVKVEPVADDDGINGEDEKKTDLEGKGAKRKRAPPTKGPCEHGVKYRSQCKVCSACPHGRQRLMQGVRWVANLRARSSALSVQGVRWVTNLRARSSTLSMQGVRWVINLRAWSSSALGARSAVGINMRARSCALCMQGVRWGCNLRARSYALSVQGVRWVHQSASTVVGALSARSARSSERIINQITTSQSVLVPSPFTRPPPPPFLHKSLSHHEAGSKITVAEVQSTRRWPLQQTNTTQGRARLPPLEATMEAFRRQVSGTGAKKKKPEPVTRDAYGFVVRNPNP